jgi:predicted Zn finger-like uncharacterized protein
VYTRCPECHTRYPITAVQLRAGRGEALCEACNIAFDALATLEQTDPDTRPLLTPKPGQSVKVPTLRGGDDLSLQTQTNEDGWSGLSLAAESRPASRGKAQSASRKRGTAQTRQAPPTKGSAWTGLTLGLLLVLWAQYLYFENERLLQNPDIRSWLERACSALGCTLPPYHDLNAIQTSHATLQKTGASGSAYEFRLVMSNQSPLPQSFPRLQLTLGEIDGKTIAERVFQPSEYLAGKAVDDLMMTGKPYEVRLVLAMPNRSIGSYRFSMI